MENIEFLEYIPTPTEKCKGIAVIKYGRAFIFRYKIIDNPKGEGCFCNAPSVSLGDGKYKEGFEIDSRFEDKRIREFVLDNVKMHGKSVHSQEPQKEQFDMPF